MAKRVSSLGHRHTGLDLNPQGKLELTYAATAGARNSTLTLYSTNPQLTLEDTGAASDEGVWNIIGNTDTLTLRALDDSYTNPVTVLTFNRGTGTAVSDATFSVPVIVSNDTYPQHQVKDESSGASGAHTQYGVDASGVGGAVGTTQHTDSTSLYYRQYMAYDMYWDDDSDIWTAMRTSLGRKSALTLGYHQGGLKYIYRTATFTTQADSGFTELMFIDGENNLCKFKNALLVPDGVTAPSTQSGWACIYVDTSDGDLKVKFGDGTVKTIATDT